MGRIIIIRSENRWSEILQRTLKRVVKASLAIKTENKKKKKENDDNEVRMK